MTIIFFYWRNKYLRRKNYYSKDDYNVIKYVHTLKEEKYPPCFYTLTNTSYDCIVINIICTWKREGERSIKKDYWLMIIISSDMHYYDEWCSVRFIMYLVGYMIITIFYLANIKIANVVLILFFSSYNVPEILYTHRHKHFCWEVLI